MSYVQKVLLPDERVTYIAAIHWIIFVQGLSITILGGALGFYSYPMLSYLLGEGFAQQMGKPLAGLGLLVAICGLILLILAYIRQASTELAITNRRIIAKYGFISRATFEIMLTRVTGANFDQTIMGRCLGYGTILVHGAGGEISPIDIVSDPQGFHKALMGVLEKAQSQQFMGR